MDLISKQKKMVNPSSRAIFNFGLVPALGSNNSLVFFPPSPSLPLISTNKQPRHTSAVLTTDKSKKSHKIKAQKKLAKSINKNEFSSSKSKKFNKVPIPKTFHKGTYNRANRCIPELCQPPNCRCGSTDIPGTL